jgi:hypothetical protein
MTSTTGAATAETAEPAPADYGPFRTREEAEACLTGWRSLMPLAPQIRHRNNLETLTDALDMLGAELGEFDREVLGQVADLDPLTVVVLVSLIRRAAHDVTDLPVVVTFPHERAEILAARP